MKAYLYKGFIAATVMSLTIFSSAGAEQQPYDERSVRDIPSAFRNVVVRDNKSASQRDRRGSYHGVERDRNSREYRRQNRGYRETPRNNSRYNFGQYTNRRHDGDRRDFSFFTYTSQPLRGGSSRRTRIIENPYSDRLVTGITLTGIDNNPVHIRDVVAYPGRQLVSPLQYSVSQYSAPRYINTYAYMDYISVAAKRKEYFTVTFHYD